MSTIGVVGLGAMGTAFARRLLHLGHEVLVWNRTPEKAAPLLALGAIGAASPAEAARRADAVITMVSDPQALVDVTEGTAGIAAGVTPERTVIEMSTVGPAAVARLASALPDGSGLLDAPVLGSTAEAEAGSLQVFVGGPKELVTRWRPLMEGFGRVHHVGSSGSGAAAKLVANAALFAVLGALGEALALADSLGLSEEMTFDVLAATPLGIQSERRRAAIETGEFPLRFPLGLAAKDAELIAAVGIDLPLFEAARRWMSSAAAAETSPRDYSSVLEYIRRARG